MSIVFRLAGACLAALTVAGCAYSTDYPYVVYGNPVNPTPLPTYRVQCSSVPTITYPLFTDFSSGCRQVQDVPVLQTRTVVRASG